MSSMVRRATTANAILGLLALRPGWSTWELAQELRRPMRFFWPRVESRVFEEAKRLEEGGFVRATRTHVGRRPRTTYEITVAGRRRLDCWLATPPQPTMLESEPLLRVLFADLGTPEQLRAALQQVRSDGQAILDLGRLVAPEYRAGRAPFQDDIHVRALVFDFLAHQALMFLEWAERAEEALERWPDQSTEQRESEALRRIEECLAEFPPRTQRRRRRLFRPSLRSRNRGIGPPPEVGAP